MSFLKTLAMNHYKLVELTDEERFELCKFYVDRVKQYKTILDKDFALSLTYKAIDRLAALRIPYSYSMSMGIEPVLKGTDVELDNEEKV